jgi:hypothetical protein
MNKINIIMTGRKKITADQILDLYNQAKKEKKLYKKEEIMKKVIYLSKYLNEYVPLDRVVR